LLDAFDQARPGNVVERFHDAALSTS
jgi:hypothetical protein